MTNNVMETDYLIIGCGAMGIAFADEIFTGDPSARLTIVDRREKPGGHWNDAYDYVTLHQPAAFYGVNSLELGNGTTDLSSKGEILTYFQNVVDKFLASGRVEFLNKHDYLGDKKVASLDDPDNIIEFKVNRRVVNGTYMGVEVPATHPPKFPVDDLVPFVTPNDLVHEYDKWDRFYVLGCGKTSMDALLFLLSKNVPVENIYWVMPNDIWCFDRAAIQVGTVPRAVLGHAKALVKAKTTADPFLEKEKEGGILRLDESVMPRKWKCATVNLEEIKQLRRVKNTIRKGRIKHLTQAGMQFDKETISYPEGSLFVNCTADGLAQRAAKPLFSDGHIDLQSIFFCQQVFSAAAIGKLELTNLSDKKRNAIKAIPHPEFEEDWPKLFSMTIDNLLRMHLYFPMWMFRSRLNFLSHEPFPLYLGYAFRALLMARPLRKAARRIARAA